MTTMKTWTVKQVMRLGPCPEYPRTRIKELWRGREQLTALEVCDLDIPAEDRIGLLLSSGPHVAPAVERIVTRAIRDHALNCGTTKVEEWARKWLSGEDRSTEAADAAQRAISSTTLISVLEAAREEGTLGGWVWAAWAAEDATKAARWAGQRAESLEGTLEGWSRPAWAEEEGLLGEWEWAWLVVKHAVKAAGWAGKYAAEEVASEGEKKVAASDDAWVAETEWAKTAELDRQIEDLRAVLIEQAEANQAEVNE